MTTKTKILFGLESAEGGALKHLTYLACNLNPKKFDITVIISDRRSRDILDEINTMRSCGIRVIVINMKRNISPISDAIAFVKIVRHLASEKFDIVHAHSSKAGFLFRVAAWALRVKSIIYTPHCFYFQGKKGIAKYFFIGIEMMLSWITDFIVVSNSEKTEALKYRVAKPARLVGINNSIRIAHTAVHPENNVPQRAEFGLGENAIVVGSVGRLTKQKDWLTYLRAAKEALAVTDNIAFLIVGEGEELGTINRAVEKFGLQDKVITTGYRRDMNKIFSLIDIYINTSLWEGLPYVVVEAMMYKKPIIATNLEYGKIIMNSRSGYLVDVGEYKSIAAKIIKLVNDKKLRKRLGMFGYQLSKRHLSFKKFIYKHEDLYLQKNVSSSPVIFDTDETTDSICLQ